MTPPSRGAPILFVFGRDLDDAAARAEAEKQAGRVPQGQYGHCVIWRGPGPIPAPKWTTETTSLTKEEWEDWTATALVQIGAEPKPRGDPKAFEDFVDLLEVLRAAVKEAA
ncbi:hypothetical protein [Methylobacterium soli]|uniref:Uncharacterized protein n=1 Tax=Methylobacterium soli TaxID=553447 RepID=A0A6L3T0V3_9HYPH|nr:hypothetical protein [Methylobacterium soli]KAB1078230.1 hypothetical protein F6X53_15875 [Methylobacterium soli]GJE45047.1 hypothetical protein AEGHOMDF_4241 [Methylobacterium soli]